MLRWVVAATLLAAVWAGLCSPGGRRVTQNQNESYVFPGSNESRSQAAGVDVKEFMPSEGNLYLTPVDGSSASFCYAGSPIGYLNADMCCKEVNGDCEAAGFLNVRGGSLIDAVGVDNLKDDVTVPVYADHCSTPVDRKGERSLQRTASQLMEPQPPAVPFEFTGAGLSACNCRNEALELRNIRESITSANSRIWQNVLKKKQAQSTVKPSFDGSSSGTCLFYRAGWAFESDEEKVVPIVPPRLLNSNTTGGSMRISIEDSVINFGNPEANDQIELPCGGKFSLDSDLNFCFYDIPDDLTFRYVSQPAVDDLSSFCNGYNPDYGVPETIKAMRCCMKLTVDDVPITAIKADIMSAAGCRNVNNAVNNGDGKMHHVIPTDSELRHPSEDEMFDLYDGDGEPQGVLYTDFGANPTEPFRRTQREPGFNQVCTMVEDSEAMCDTYTAEERSAETTVADTFEAQKKVQNTCLIPSVLITGEPNHHYFPEYAASLYNMHAPNLNYSYACQDPDAVAELIKASNGENTCEKLRQWSHMSPGVYHSSGSIPVPTAQWLGHCGVRFTDDKTREGPKRNMNHDCSISESDPIDASPLEKVTATQDLPHLWSNIVKNCGFAGDLCKFAPQLSYASTVYTATDEQNVTVVPESVACVNMGSSAVVQHGEDIIFVTAAPRTQGTVHPGYDAGGYVGGRFSKPGYRRMRDDTPEQSGEKHVISPDGKTIDIIGIAPSSAGEVTSLTGALVIDDACYLNNHRGARQEYDQVSIAGQWPRFMDINAPKQYTYCWTAAGTTSATASDTYLQLVGSQPFFDYYGRGYGTTENPYGFNDFSSAYSNIPSYYMYTDKHLRPSSYLRPSDGHGVCVSTSANGCLGVCDQGKLDAARATAITKTVIGSLEIVGGAAAAVFTDGVVGPGVLVAAGSTETATGSESLAQLNDGVTDIGDTGSASYRSLDYTDPWKYFLRATFDAKGHSPVAKNRAQYPDAAYRHYPSNIKASADSSTNFGDWTEEVRAFPAQTVAAQLGCHTAFEGSGLFKRNAPIENFDAVSQRETFSAEGTQQDTLDRVDFALVGKKDLEAYMPGRHYFLKKNGEPYTPVRDASMHNCGLCAMWAPVAVPSGINAPFWVTPPVEECQWESKTMRYSLEADHNLQDTMLHRSGIASKLVNATSVTMQFGWLVDGRTMTWSSDGDDDDNSVLLQRLLGRNLTFQGYPLSEPLCQGDASAELGKCAMDETLHLQWEHSITCKDETRAFKGACINPIWANDEMIVTPSHDSFVPEAELLSYCAAMDVTNFDGYGTVPNYADYNSLYESDPYGNPYFIICENDRLNEQQRHNFCSGSGTTLPGKNALAGVRMRARMDITDVCDTKRRRCVLFPDDPQGWSLNRVVKALEGYADGTYIINLIPVSHNFLELLSFWTTLVETSWFNDAFASTMPTALKDAYSEASSTLPLFRQYGNITWRESATLAPQVCRAGGPDTALAFGMLWARIELLRGPSNKFDIMSLNKNGGNHTATFSESEVYKGFPDINARLENRGVIIKSAFNEEARQYARQLVPDALQHRFSQVKRAVFDATPSDSASPTCTRIYTERKIEIYDVEFVQDADGCRTLAEVDRVPVILSGADARNSVFTNVQVVGGTASLVARGLDSSVFENIVSANVDVDNLLLKGTYSTLRWREGCSGTALDCSNITFMPGVGLALARADGNVVVDECPYGATELWACSAGVGRLQAAVLVATEAGEPMYDWSTGIMPSNCSNSCSVNGTTSYCYQGYSFTCVDGEWLGQFAIAPTDTEDESGFGNPLEQAVENFCVNDNNPATENIPADQSTLMDDYPWNADLPPCARYTQAIMSTGAVIRGNSTEDLAAKTLKYDQQMSNHQRCSTIGCPGHKSVVLVDGAYRCGVADAYVEDSGWWEWHFHPQVPLALNGLHVKDNSHAALPWQPMITDVSMTSPMIQQGKLQISEGVCVARNGTDVTFDACDDFSQEQNWLFVRLEAHFRVEVPNDPFLCIVMPAANATVVLLPCPPCLYGSSSPEVSMNRFDEMPSLTATGDLPNSNTVRIPLTTDPTSSVALTVNTETGLCECATQVIAPSYRCGCSLENYRRTDVYAQLGEDGCSGAAGALLAACERLGAGLAAVDGTKFAMKAICSVLGRGTAEVTGADGYGGSVACVDDMVQVVTMGGNYQPSEPLLVNVSNRMLPGLSAITSKIIFQPHSGSMPTTITAEYRSVINATGFLGVFGNGLYRITSEGFSTGGVVWAGVIVELVVITLALILHCAFAATSASRVAEVKERITAEKKDT